MFYFFSKMWKFEKVNIIPLIAKADTLTPDECDDFKREIIREIETHKINVYEFPDHDDEEENKYVPILLQGARNNTFFQNYRTLLKGGFLSMGLKKGFLSMTSKRSSF